MNTLDQSHQKMMSRAIKLAQKAWGQTHDNPMVGALIVHEGSILSEGYHQYSGGPHAEVMALEGLKEIPNEQTQLFITLEPCSTEGRTGACTNAILNSGIKKVIVGTLDPNPKHAGKGIELLKSNGIDVVTGILEADCRDLNILFNHWITQKKPLCALKMALTLDGCLAASTGQSKWITGEKARENVMHWRRLFPAIGVTETTVLNDNPRLTSRLDGKIDCPKRFIFNRRLKGLEDFEKFSVYNDAFKGNTTIIYGEGSSKESIKSLEKTGLNAWQIRESQDGLLFEDFLKRCAEASICGIFIEPGAKLATHLIQNKIADYLFIYQSPKLLLDQEALTLGINRASQRMDESINLSEIRRSDFGDDHLVRGLLKL